MRHARDVLFRRFALKRQKFPRFEAFCFRLIYGSEIGIESQLNSPREGVAFCRIFVAYFVGAVLLLLETSSSFCHKSDTTTSIYARYICYICAVSSFPFGKSSLLLCAVGGIILLSINFALQVVYFLFDLLLFYLSTKLS